MRLNRLLAFLLLSFLTPLRAAADRCPPLDFRCLDGIVMMVAADGITATPAASFRVRVELVDDWGNVLESYAPTFTGNDGTYHFNPIPSRQTMPFPGGKMRIYAWHDGIRWGNERANALNHYVPWCNGFPTQCRSTAATLYTWPSPLQVDRVHPGENEFVRTGGCDDTYSWTDAVDASRRNPSWPVRYSLYGDGVELHDLTERQVTAALQECGTVVWQVVAGMEVPSTNLNGTRVWQDTASPFFVNPAQCCEVWNLE